MIPYCSGHARDVKTARCSGCGLDTHLYCQGSGLEQEEEPVTCVMCQARAAGGGGKDTNQLRNLVFRNLLEKATTDIKASTNKLRQLEAKVQEVVNTLKRLDILLTTCSLRRLSASAQFCLAVSRVVHTLLTTTFALINSLIHYLAHFLPIFTQPSLPNRLG